MKCSKCNNELPGGWSFPCCPHCGAPIAAPGAGAVSLGDANAIAGDVAITTNIHNVERQKGAEEVKAENTAQYRALCRQALADGIVTQEESALLEEARTRLGLSETEARQAMESVKAGMQRHSKTALGKIQQMSLNQILKLMENGKTESLRGAMGRLEMMAQKYDADEVQCNYWMIMAALEPARCIELYTNRSSDSYWQSYWTVMAYVNTGDAAAAEGLLSDLEAWSDMPFGNIALLAAAHSLAEYWKDPTIEDFRMQAEAFAEEGASGNTDLIDPFAQALMMTLGAEGPEDLADFHDDFAFQLDYVLRGVTEAMSSHKAHAAIPEIPKIDLLPE